MLTKMCGYEWQILDVDMDAMRHWGTTKGNQVMGGILETDGGLLSVDLEGNETAHYDDIELALTASGIEVTNAIYCGSLTSPYMYRKLL